MTKRHLFATAALLLALLPATLLASDRVLLTVYSSDGPVQRTAMALAASLADDDAEVHILLCGKAAEIGLSNHRPEALEPRAISPQEVLQRAITNGATASVCPLFLPNMAFGRYSSSDLLDGVSEDSEEDMHERLMNQDTRIIGF